MKFSSDQSLKNAVAPEPLIFIANSTMEKRANPDLFVNDGSFMERFKQLQQEKQDKTTTSVNPNSNVSIGSSTLVKPALIANKRPLEIKANDGKKPSPASNRKLAFSLKQKSKVMTPAVKLGDDDEEERGDMGGRSGEDSAKRQKFGALDVSQSSTQHDDGAPSLPSDPTVKTVADRLAIFVAKNGRQLEYITREKNPGDTPFKFLFDTSSADYKYYMYRLFEEEMALAQTQGSQATDTNTMSNTTSRSSGNSQRSHIEQHSNYQTPASALYDSSEDTWSNANGESSEPSSADPIAMMEYYVKKAAQEERKRPPKHSKDEMHHLLLFKVLHRRATTWVITFHLMSSKSF